MDMIGIFWGIKTVIRNWSWFALFDMIGKWEIFLKENSICHSFFLHPLFLMGKFFFKLGGFLHRNELFFRQKHKLPRISLNSLDFLSLLFKTSLSKIKEKMRNWELISQISIHRVYERAPFWHENFRENLGCLNLFLNHQCFKDPLI